MARSTAEANESTPFLLAESASHLLRRVEQLAADRFTRLVGEAVTLRQFTVLAAIAATPGHSQSDLVRATGIDRSTLADIVSRMEQRNWIARSASLLDARAHAVRLAPDGEMLLRSAAKHARAADAAILDALPRGKRKALLNTLIKLTKLADESAAKAAHAVRPLAKPDARRLKPDRPPAPRRRAAARKQSA